MRFDRQMTSRVGPARPPNYLSRRVQRRLFTLIAMLFAVLLLMQRAQRPDSWTWLWKISGQPLPSDTESDTKAVRPPAEKPASEPAAAESTQTRPSRTLPPVTSALRDSYRRIDVMSDSSSATTWPWHPQLDHEALQVVRDASFFRPEERGAWFHLLSLLSTTPPTELAALSIGPVTRLQLDQQTATYRGRIVDVAGIVRRLTWVTAPANEGQIAGYWQAWLFPAQGGTNPIVLYLLEIPASLSAGDSVSYPISVTGFVYKRWSYRAEEGMALAPVILAATMQHYQEKVEEPSAPPTARMTAAIVLGISFAALATVSGLFWFTSRSASHRMAAHTLPASIEPPTLASEGEEEGPRLESGSP